MDLTEESHRRLLEDDFELKTVPLARKSIVYLEPGDIEAPGFDKTEHWFQNCYASEDKQLLVCGAAAAQELRDEIFSQLGFTCSAGVAHNKMLAKVSLFSICNIINVF